MTSTLSKKSAVPIPEQRSGFMGMSGLYEGVMGALDRRRMGSLISDSIKGGADAHDLVSQAAEVFIRQSDIQQGRFLDDIDSRIQALASRLTTQSANEIQMLAEFIRHASGHPSIEPTVRHMGLASKLATISDSDKLSAYQDYDAMRISCMRAAWAIGHDDLAFWSGRIADPLTRPFAIEKVLDATHFDGWPILMESLERAGPDIANSASINRMRFLSDCLSSPDERIVGNALKALLSLQSIPEELASAIEALTLRLPRDMISKKAAALVMVADIKRLMSGSEEGWFMGARKLLSLYRQGNHELAGTLISIGSIVLSSYIHPSEDTLASVMKFQGEASMLMLSLSVAGIEVPGSGFSMDFDD
jgi:hypothetical protein